ncbi:MAG: heme-binding domain-containing protein, partial [Prolixibacteraceae bacterium]|nr:heme-binding domain-containing protein [Prolixibacteraceae bacterium]
FLILSIIFIGLQFFQPEKNNQPADQNHLFSQAIVPEPVQQILNNACMDCHSNQTHYPWYDRISPVSWYVNNHIEEGKEELNFSEWGQLSNIDKINRLTKISEETKEGKMPLKSYTFMHKQAKLTEEQVSELCSWTETYGMEVYKANF